MSKVLYLSYDGITDPLGQSQVLPYLVGLSAKGHRIHIISFEKPEAFAANRGIIEKICASNGIQWHPLKYTKRPPVLSTVNDIIQLRKKIKSLHAKEGFSILHCRSYITALTGLWAQKKLGVKFIFDMRGFWADERVEGGLWNLKNPLYRTIYRFFKKKEGEFFSRADYTVSLTHNAKALIMERFGKRRLAPIEVIPCCVDLQLFDMDHVSAEQVSARKRSLSIPSGAKVLSYIGSVGTWYMLDEMLLFFKTWLRKDPTAIFLFITNDDPAIVQEKGMAYSIPESSLRIVKGKRAEMPQLIACSDYSLFFIRPVFSKRASSPTKQGEIMAMGKPLVCNSRIGDTDHVVNTYQAGIVLDEFTEAHFAEKIELLKKADFNAYRIRQGAAEFYSLNKGVDKYNAIYQSFGG